MKQVTAVVKPFKLDDVKSALEVLGRVSLYCNKCLFFRE